MSCRKKLQELAKQETITIEDIKKLFESFGVQSALESKDLPQSQSLMMFLCRTDQMTVPMMQMLVDEAKKISDENNSDNNNAFLKKQLEFALRANYDDDQEYNGVPFISVVCAGTSSLPLIQLIFVTCTEVFGKKWLLKQLQLEFGRPNKTKALRWICKYARSVDVVRFVFSTFLEIGDKAALEKELDDLDGDEKSVLTDICSQRTSSVEMTQLIMDQYSAAGGDEFLKKHLLFETRKISALTIVATSSCPDSVLDFFLTKIGDVCGVSVLREQLASSKTTPLAVVCKKVKVENIGRAKLMMSKILENCGKETLKKCLQSKERFGFLHSVLDRNRSAEMLQLLLDTAKDNFGTEFAKEYLLDADLFAGLNLLHIVVKDMESTARLELAIRITLELGGPETMKKCLRSQKCNSEMRSPLHNLCSFSSRNKLRDGVPEKKLKFVIDQMLSVEGKNFLREQLEAVDSYGCTGLHFACGHSGLTNTVSGAVETVHMLIDAIGFVGGNNFPLNIFDKKTSRPETSNLAVFLFHEGLSFPPRIEVVEIVLAKIIDVGNGKELLRKYLSVDDKNGKPVLCSVSSELGEFFAAVLFELGLFQEQYAKLDDATKEQLKKWTKIENDEWQPSDELKKRVANLLLTKEEQEEASHATKKKAEEEAAARKMIEDEEVAVRNKIKEEEVNAKQKCERDAAAAKKKADDDEAAAKKKKADDDEAAAKKKKADDDEAAAKKKKADDEAAAKKKADDEATAKNKKADDEAAAESTLKAIIAGGVFVAAVGIAIFSLNKRK